MKEYSILALVNRFESERDLLKDMPTITSNEYLNMMQFFNTIKTGILELKNMCSDIDVFNTLCENNDESEALINKAYSTISKCDIAIMSMKGKITKLFQTYQQLIWNYELYSKAVNTYTSYVLECFFNDYSKFEIC